MLKFIQMFGLRRIKEAGLWQCYEGRWKIFDRKLSDKLMDRKKSTLSVEYAHVSSKVGFNQYRAKNCGDSVLKSKLKLRSICNFNSVSKSNGTITK